MRKALYQLSYMNPQPPYLHFKRKTRPGKPPTWTKSSQWEVAACSSPVFNVEAMGSSPCNHCPVFSCSCLRPMSPNRHLRTPIMAFSSSHHVKHTLEYVDKGQMLQVMLDEFRGRRRLRGLRNQGRLPERGKIRFQL